MNDIKEFMVPEGPGYGGATDKKAESTEQER